MNGAALKPALILLSGGLDSATVLAIAMDRGYQVTAMSFDYGQRHRLELERSAAMCRSMGIPHVQIHIPLDQFGGSALTDPELDVPDVPEAEIGTGGIPITYVPGRNMIFLSIAAAYCELHGITEIFIGTNAVDYSGYPDCRPAFIDAMTRTVNLGTRFADEARKLTIHTPLASMGKADIIRTGLKLGVDYGLTTTCYNPFPDGTPCGKCDACKLRRRGFREAGSRDPLTYPETD